MFGRSYFDDDMAKAPSCDGAMASGPDLLDQVRIVVMNYHNSSFASKIMLFPHRLRIYSAPIFSTPIGDQARLFRVVRSETL